MTPLNNLFGKNFRSFSVHRKASGNRLTKIYADLKIFIISIGG